MIDFMIQTDSMGKPDAWSHRSLASGRRWGRVLAVAGGLGLCAFAGACSAAAREAGLTDARPERLPKMTLDCVCVAAIDDWRVLNDYDVVIYGPARARAYLVELTRRCHSLKSADVIGISSRHDGRLCSFGGDAIIARDEHCPVGAIRPYKTGDAGDAGGPGPGSCTFELFAARSVGSANGRIRKECGHDREEA